MITFKGNEVRCVAFTNQDPDGQPSGQQMVLWLPAGSYNVAGKEEIKVSRLGLAENVVMVKLVKDNKVYYISPAFLPEMKY